LTEAEHGRVTIRAIADEAGVSVPTVSRVINGRSDVAPDASQSPFPKRSLTNEKPKVSLAYADP
jgi:hypothetical protein